MSEQFILNNPLPIDPFGKRSALFRLLYAGCQRAAFRLMPYRYLLWESLQTMELKPDSKILGIGRGAENLVRFMAEKKLTAEGTADFRAVVGLELLPFENNFFDRIVCLNTFTNFENRIFLINELKRVLKPNGTLLLISENEGLKAIPAHIYGHLARVRNIWGVKRKARALSLLFPLTFALFLKQLLSIKLKMPALNIEELFNDNGLTFFLKQDNLKNSIYLCAPAASKSADPIEEGFKEYSAKYNLKFPSLNSDNKIIVNAGLADLKRDGSFFDQLAAAYKQIFGSSEIWAEGAYCSVNAGHMISLEKYDELRLSGDLKCPCGGHYRPCYPREYFQRLITDQLAKDKTFDPFCSLYKVNKRIGGFIWGAAAPLESCLSRISKVPNWVDKADWRAFVGSVNRRLTNEFGLDNKTKLLYVDDLGILPDFRKGIDPMMLLLRQAFSHAVINETQHVLCWTSKKSPLYKFAVYAAFKEVATSESGVTFMLCKDIVPALKILQNKPRSMLPVMIANAKLSSQFISA